MIKHNDLVVRLGDNIYKVHRPWPHEDIDMQGISDVTVMSDGRIAVLRRNSPQIIIFSTNGDKLDEWVVPGLVSGHYMRARSNGGLLIADLCSHNILMIDSYGDCIGSLGEAGNPKWNAPFNNPTSAIEDFDGSIYVTDGYGNSCLHCFDSEGNIRFTSGNPGSGDGEFTTPHAVVITDDGRVLVSDRENHRIQAFDRNGRYQGEIGLLYKPMAMALMTNGSLLVTDQTPTLSLFSNNGDLLGRCRTYGVYGHGLAAAPDGSIYIAEMSPDTLTKLIPF